MCAALHSDLWDHLLQRETVNVGEPDMKERATWNKRSRVKIKAIVSLCWRTIVVMFQPIYSKWYMFMLLLSVSKSRLFYAIVIHHNEYSVCFHFWSKLLLKAWTVGSLQWCFQKLLYESEQFLSSSYLMFAAFPMPEAECSELQIKKQTSWSEPALPSSFAIMRAEMLLKSRWQRALIKLPCWF